MMNKCASPKWYGIKNVMILISLGIVVFFTATYEQKLLAQEPGMNTLANHDNHKAKEQISTVRKSKTYHITKDTVVEDKSGKPVKHSEVIVIVKDTAHSVKENEYVDILSDSKFDSARHSNNDRIEKIIINRKGNGSSPMVIINGKKVSAEELDKMDPSEIERVDVWKDEASIEKYGSNGKNGVVEVKTKTISMLDGVKTGLTISEKEKSLDVSIIDENKIKPDSPYVVNVVDNEGRAVYNTKTKDKSFQIPTDKLKKGDYFISVVNVENHYSCSNNYSLKHN